MSASTERMLTNVRSCLNQNPLSNCCATTSVAPPRALARSVCASRSAGGATNSPARNVTIASGMPMRTTDHVTCDIDVPDARITVYSELATSCDMANSVPISAATGKSSYMRDGRCSATYSSAEVNV
jgi:hypothetical protein